MATEYKSVKGKIATRQRQGWAYSVALCSIFWQIRGLKDIMEFG